MIPANVLAERLALVTHIDALVAREIVDNWKLLSPDSRLSTRLIPDLMDVVTEIATVYGEISAVAAADFYDYMAELSGARVPPAVAVSAVPKKDQVENVVRWATAPLRFDTPLPQSALERVVGVTQRLSLRPGRMTTHDMVRRDRGRYAHVPQGAKTCAFCLMLASRGAVYWSEQPHYHDHCVIGSTLVNGPSTELALRRWYEGEVIVIRTTSGDELTITPNHPVLTRAGWVLADELDVGQEIVERSRSERNKALIPDEQDQPAFIENVWSALSVDGLVAVPTASQDFHGDGAGSDGKVHVIASNRLFSSKGHSMLCETCGQIIGAPAGAASIADPFPPGRDTPRGCLGLGLASHSLVGGGGLGHAHLGSHLGCTGKPRRSVTATFNASLSEPARYDTAGNFVFLREREFTSAGQIGIGQTIRRLRQRSGRATPIRTRFDPPSLESDAERFRVHTKLGCDLLERLTGGIEFSRISHLDRIKFAGHVYNLQTVEGWYSANNLIISNCDCLSVPIFEPDDLPDINRRLQDEWDEATAGRYDQLKAWREHIATTRGQ